MDESYYEFKEYLGVCIVDDKLNGEGLTGWPTTPPNL